ncbi:MAG: hypothetical protein AB7I37_27360 [Pirellulales bacterium]
MKDFQFVSRRQLLRTLVGGLLGGLAAKSGQQVLRSGKSRRSMEPPLAASCLAGKTYTYTYDNAGKLVSCRVDGPAEVKVFFYDIPLSPLFDVEES